MPQSAVGAAVVVDSSGMERARVCGALVAGGWRVVATDDAAEAIEALAAIDADVLLIDHEVHHRSSDLMRAISLLHPHIVRIVMTTTVSDEEFVEAVGWGAFGYLPKDIGSGELLAHLASVLAGGVAFPGALTRRLVEELGRRDRRRTLVAFNGSLVHLSDRELDVLELVRTGSTTAEMSRRLFIAPVTVRTHVAALCRKLRAPDREALRNLPSTPDGRTDAVPMVVAAGSPT